MPQFVPRDRAVFIHGPIPALVLALDRDQLQQLPAAENTNSWPPPALAGWQLLHRLTLCAVDGPGDAGLLVQALLEESEAEAMFAWLEDVDTARGALVVARPAADVLPDEPADPQSIYNKPGARGGFIRAI